MKNKSGKSLKKMLAVTSVTAVLGVTVIGGSMASPAMAESIKGIPLVSNLMKEITGSANRLNEGPSWSMGKDGGKTYNVQGSEHSQIMTDANGEARNIIMDVEWPDLKVSYKQQMETALQQLFHENIHPDTVRISIQYGDLPATSPIKSGAVYLLAEVNNTIVTLEDGKLHRIQKKVATGEVDKASLQAAESIFEGRALEGLKKGEHKNTTYLMNNGKEVYEFEFASTKVTHPVFVTVEKGTNRILKVDASDLAEKIEDMPQAADKMEAFSADQLLTEAKAQAKQLLHVDLTGYQAAKDPSKLGVVTLTKEGEPAVIGKFNAKGQLYALQLAELSPDI